ncbi:hypothetical protein HGB48_36230, partial [Actinomadura latina]|nr:hypothetical protein [Actinomadura latina]
MRGASRPPSTQLDHAGGDAPSCGGGTAARPPAGGTRDREAGPPGSEPAQADGTPDSPCGYPDGTAGGAG